MEDERLGRDWEGTGDEEQVWGVWGKGTWRGIQAHGRLWNEKDRWNGESESREVQDKS